VNAMLNAMPLHYMQAFMLSKWVLNTIIKITHRFLWRDTTDTFSGGHCLVPWNRVTLPKQFGLGLIDLKPHNQALLMKWLWLANQNNQYSSLWNSTLASIDYTLPIDPTTTPQHHNIFLYGGYNETKTNFDRHDSKG
jgi:hypothetical protein